MIRDLTQDTIQDLIEPLALIQALMHQLSFQFSVTFSQKHCANLSSIFDLAHFKAVGKIEKQEKGSKCKKHMYLKEKQPDCGKAQTSKEMTLCARYFMRLFNFLSQ